MAVLTKEQAKEIVKVYGIKTVEDAHDAVKDLMREFVQTALEAELDESLGYTKYGLKDKKTSNSRNGYYDKEVHSSMGEIELQIPRDRDGEHEPVIVKKGQSDISGLQERIISMYGRGMSTRDIAKHMNEIYGVNLSAESISNITDRILPKIKEWQARPLQPIYPILYMDAIHFNVRDNGQIVKKAIYIAIGIDCDGLKDVLGIWIGGNESAKFWLGVLNEIKNRGVKDIFIACVDGLTGFDTAITTVYPKSEIQRCIVHQIRYCCKFVNWQDRKEFCNDMKAIYTAPSEEAALEALVIFADNWGKKYSYAVKSWENNWVNLSTFYKYSSDIRRLIYTTNPIESVNSSIRKVAGPKRIFPTDDAALKSVYLAIDDRMKKWTMRIQNWGSVFGQLAIHFGDRLEVILEN